ncbi:hypothetical protein C882_3339 [Caenispirillum salinarum AK4]|uniref:Glycosyltransferase n=1 Tax=Caenispirillum salinarum AK4 TaxID=1238182 RepID=K9GLX7_9PROT|nr:hypothetical protein C882_3339 [Caenispirillum salinarum AK4]
MICHQITCHLARSGLFDVRYVVINAFETAMPGAAGPEVEDLKALGVHFHEPVKADLTPAAGAGAFNKLKAVAAGHSDRLIVGTGQQDKLLRSLGGEMPDAVLAIWAETAGYMASSLPIPKFNYAGNPDHKVLEARMELEDWLGGRSLLGRARDVMRLKVTRAGHLAAMRRYDLMWNVAANDAADYAAAGVNARYLQNMWPGAVHADWQAGRDASEQTAPLKIVGNVGNISATGNSFGLMTLATQIVPRLKEKLGEGAFEVHLFGGGKPHPSVAPLLNDPHIRVRGFVDDIDAEILSAPVFLVANNSQRFKVGHTRFLHAWSLGACVVGFSDSAEAMPEIRHRENALLGDTPEAVADLVVEAGRDKALRRAVAAGGIEMLTTAFNPARVVGELIRDLDARLTSRKTGVAA